eukprot:4938850-Prymnesium_polylepis.1
MRQSSRPAMLGRVCHMKEGVPYEARRQSSRPAWGAAHLGRSWPVVGTAGVAGAGAVAPAEAVGPRAGRG